MIDARRQSSDSGSDSDFSRPSSTVLYTQDTGKAGLQPRSHGRVSPRGFTGDESLRPSAAPEESAHNSTSNIQTTGPAGSDVQKRSLSSAGDADDTLSSLLGSQTPWYLRGPLEYGESQLPYSYNYFMGVDNLSAPPSPGSIVSREGFAPQDQYGHTPGKPATYYETSPSPPPVTARPIVRDHTTSDLAPGGNEYLTSETDPSGETKVSKDGHPLEGRVFRLPTFQLPHRGDTLFMLGEECSRALRFGTSNLLFKYNSSLLKIIVSETEKQHLIQQGIVPESDISQQIAVVTARSMFRQFGARMIQDGRRVRDDYWEADARQQGFTEEDVADETTPGATRAREAVPAQARSKGRRQNLWKNIKQKLAAEDAVGNPGTRHDKLLVDDGRAPDKASGT